MTIKEQELEVILQKEVTPPKANAAIVERALTQMNFSDAAKKLLLDPTSSETKKTSLQNIALTQEHLSQVKKSLGALIDSLQENPSLISRAAAFWGERPLWQRIVGGVVISGPTLLIGASAHIGFLVSISGFSALAYTTSGLVLDDHHYHTKNITQKLKEGIFGVAEVLELTIGALDSIRQKLAVEIEQFKAENLILANNISRMSIEIDTLSSQVECMIETEKLLRTTKEELEKTAALCKTDLQLQAKLIESNKIEVAQIKEAHAKSMLQLSEKITELALVREAMGAEVEKAKKTTTTLESTVKALSGAVIGDMNQRQIFQEKLNIFLSEKTSGFEQVADRMSHAESELSTVKLELKASNDRYKKLLELQESQIRRLERLDQKINQKGDTLGESQTPIKASSLLNTLGFMAIPQIWKTNDTPKASTKEQEVTLAT